MVGLVIASHGHLADEMVSTAEQIVGKLISTATCSIAPGSPCDDIETQMRRAVLSVDSGDGVIVLTDLFGGTPCNQSLRLCDRQNIEVLTGVNLPMVLKANSLRVEGMPLPELASALVRYGQKNITCASALVKHDEATQHH